MNNYLMQNKLTINTRKIELLRVSKEKKILSISFSEDKKLSHKVTADTWV